MKIILRNSSLEFQEKIPLNVELLDDSKSTRNLWLNNGSPVTYNGLTASDYMRVYSGIQYTFRRTKNGMRFADNYERYDNNKTYLSTDTTTNGTGQPVDIIVNGWDGYIRLQYPNEDGENNIASFKATSYL